MRKIKLNPKQIAIILEALNIAETAYYKKFKEMQELSGRANDYFTQNIEKDNIKYIYDTSCLFADVAFDLKNSKLDA